MCSPNWKAPAWDFGKHFSPDGIIEYSGSAFGGMLDHKYLVATYGGGDNILVLSPDAGGNITSVESGFAGLTGFQNPLDLTEDKRTGLIYVAEYGGQRITLLRPLVGGSARVSVDKSLLAMNAPVGAQFGPVGSVTLSNSGSSALALPGDALTIFGPNAGDFVLRSRPSLPTVIG